MADPTCYNFYNEKRGIALLIHNEFFYQSSGYKDRLGDDLDHRRMKKIFKRLGFTVYSYRDLTKDDILIKARRVAENEDIHMQSDCFVCVVGSHGEERQMDTDVHSRSHDRQHCIVGVDGKLLQTSELIEIFSDDNCPGLQEKPKFFFIQACRIRQYSKKNEGLDKGEDVSMVTSGSKEKRKKKKSETLDAGNENSDEEGSTEGSDSDSGPDESMYDTSDTEDDEDFLEFKKQFGEEIENRAAAGKSNTEKRNIRRKHIDELDAKGSTDEGKPVVLEHSSEKPESIQVVSDNKLDKYRYEANTRDKVMTKKKSPDRKIVPMVTIVPCPENTLIMFASLSGNFAIRGRSTGGWLLDKLYEVLKVHTKDLDQFEDTSFLEVLTEVLCGLSGKTFQPNDKSKKNLEGHFSPGCITHCLMSDVFFKKKPSKRRGLFSCLLSS